MSYTLAPYETRQYFDGNGDPLAGGFVWTYVAGTSTPAPTYSTATGTLNSNPVVLDSEGRCTIYLAASSYKFVIQNSAGVPLPLGSTADPVTAVNAGSSGLGSVFEFGGNSSSPITNTAYVSGAGYDKLHPGTAVYAMDSANLTGTHVLTVTGLVLSGTLTVAIVDLDSGSPDTPLATATITALTGAIGTSAAITFGASGTVKHYGIKVKISAGTGYAWGIKLTRTS